MTDNNASKGTPQAEPKPSKLAERVEELEAQLLSQETDIREEIAAELEQEARNCEAGHISQQIYTEAAAAARRHSTTPIPTAHQPVKVKKAK